MVDTTVNNDRSADVRWFRRRPPADLDRFLRGVWWTGHAQLFVAAGLPVVGFLLLALGRWDLAYLWFGTFALAMAIPFLYSGLLLRASVGTFPQGGEALRGRSLQFGRIARLVVDVVFIAMLAIAGVGAQLSVVILITYWSAWT
ncbi:hypothetical protein [Agromyces allii]|uniref:Uncharacterized protein n=1 Tax=Agromyces allii TaxID=393607 RepID=A0ABN2R873_9MICO|nr:hypothetical protein [Agromyces allii]